ncbi:MAG: TetR/AcrR family transcriptional regulator [Nitrospirae bacterium]|nr:TetR/AcrR family transcriptional regulator [Nitrospirota bacterium]MDA1304481.1 TetR/AcrR family transcriptional regulator [Nitrospirota bacterium]
MEGNRKRGGSSKREVLIQTALELFGKNGIHATGIDAIVERSGVTKKTLYAHFRSKEELVLAVLRQYDGMARNEFMRRVEGGGKTPQARLLAIFDFAERWFQQSNFYGCLFINTIGEYSDNDTPIRQICKDYKKLVKGYILSLCEQVGTSNPQELAEELALLLEGATVTAQVSQNPKTAKIAKRAAKALIEKATS